MKQPIGFFVHHQGRGHIRRCMSIVKHIKDRKITIFCADLNGYDNLNDNIEYIELPNMIGAPSQSDALHKQHATEILDCAPLGVREITNTMHQIVEFFNKENPALFIVDVSPEIALLARICSVPALHIRQSGVRNDDAHMGAYKSCVGLIAPYDEVLEDDNYCAIMNDNTFYTGGLCTSNKALLNKEQAREKLDIDQNEHLILVLSGGGGSGVPYAPLTMGCRAVPNSQWVVIGKTLSEGHETDFSNLNCKGWVENVSDYLAACDVVIASAGNNTVHEIARAGKPYICVPEWRYFDEQVCKARMLEKNGAAILLENWPGNPQAWRDVINKAKTFDTQNLEKLYDPKASLKAAEYIKSTAEKLWV